MKIVNHYLNRYYKLVSYYKSKIIEGFLEKHHITPRCMGGSDDTENLVLLPPRAHFMAHELLHRAYPDHRGLAHAFAMMAVNNPYQKRESSSRMYAKAKIARSKALTGSKLPEWIKEKMRVPKKHTENYKKPKTAEHAANISKSLKGRIKSQSHIESIAEANRKHYDEKSRIAKEKMDRYRTLFLDCDLSRKEFAVIHGLNYQYVKRIAKGIDR